MEKTTIEFIKTLKTNDTKKTLKEKAISYMSQLTGTPESDYDDETLYGIVKDKFLDYIKTSDEPEKDLYNYFEAKRTRVILLKTSDNPMASDLHAMLSALHMTQVRNKNTFINGFNENF